MLAEASRRLERDGDASRARRQHAWWSAESTTAAATAPLGLFRNSASARCITLNMPDVMARESVFFGAGPRGRNLLEGEAGRSPPNTPSSPACHRFRPWSDTSGKRWPSTRNLLVVSANSARHPLLMDCRRDVGAIRPSPAFYSRCAQGVNITIGWDGWAGRATLHDTDATRTHSGVHESNARRMSRRSAKLKCTLTM